LTACAAELKKSVTAVSVAARKMGLSFTRRPKAIVGNLEAQVVALIARGDSIETVARATGLSYSSVARLYSIHAEVRNEQKSAERENRRGMARARFTEFFAAGNRGVKAFRSSFSSDYAWLYRNDRNWLQMHTPEERVSDAVRAPRVDWEYRDAKAAAFVAKMKLARRLENADEKPIRQTATLLARVAGVENHIKSRPERFPATVAAIAGAAETDDEFRTRRIRWAIVSLRQQGLPLDEWRVRRLAGLETKINNLEATIAGILEEEIRPPPRPRPRRSL
jgi:molybdenum-dependent DNA-binding transcriptional regulator ModE